MTRSGETIKSFDKVHSKVETLIRQTGSSVQRKVCKRGGQTSSARRGHGAAEAKIETLTRAEDPGAEHEKNSKDERPFSMRERERSQGLGTRVWSMRETSQGGTRAMINVFTMAARECMCLWWACSYMCTLHSVRIYSCDTQL